MSNKVEICGINTADLKVLNEAEKTELLHRIRGGDEAARTEFINGNLKLVLSVIQRFSHRGEDPDDLFQIGCIGLIKAIDNFELDRGLRLSTYAVPMRCSLGKRKESLPKWMKTRRFRRFLSVQRRICRVGPTSARDMTRTRISISGLVIQNGLIKPFAKPLSGL